ncbi:MAG: hypothetical protein QXI97_04325 [Nitrososphaerota archaeon]
MLLMERTGFLTIPYGLYLVFLGLSFRSASRALKPFIDRSHVSVWRWVERLPGFRRILSARCRVSMRRL